MFKIARNPEFTHDIIVMVPVDNGHDEQKLRTRFRVLSADEITAHDFASPQGIEAYLRDIVVRFEDVVDEDGKAMNEDETKTRLLGIGFVRQALLTHYGEALRKAKTGN